MIITLYSADARPTIVADVLLLSEDSSAFALFIVDERSAIVDQLNGSPCSDSVVRHVRGRKARTVRSLFDEFAAALQFPGYFGENWDAFDECLADLDTLCDGATFILVIHNADELLRGEAGDADMRVFARSLVLAGRTWSSPIALGEWWDRPAIRSRVVLTTGEGGASKLIQRWESMGVHVDRAHGSGT